MSRYYYSVQEWEFDNFPNMSKQSHPSPEEIGLEMADKIFKQVIKPFLDGVNNASASPKTQASSEASDC